MKRTYDQRWNVIGLELLVIFAMGAVWYEWYRPLEPVASPVATSTITHATTAPAVTVSSTTTSGKGGEVGRTHSTSSNVWRGTTTASGLIPYIEVTDGCGPFYDGTCLNARRGPSTTYPVVSQLRNGMVLPVAGRVVAGDAIWYRVDLTSYQHAEYPERITSDWYVNDQYVKLLYEQPEQILKWGTKATTTKHIVVDRQTQMLSAYDGDTLVMQLPVSTGLDLTPTPLGTFTVFMRTPSTYMQGPSPSLPLKQYYDLPGVPWDLFFTKQGAVSMEPTGIIPSGVSILTAV